MKRGSRKSLGDKTLDKKQLKEAEKAAKKAEKAAKKGLKESKKNLVLESSAFTITEDHSFRVKSVRRSNQLYDPSLDDDEDDEDDDDDDEEEEEGPELWEAAAEWMTKVGALPSLGDDSASVTCEDFFMFLADGTALCEIVNTIAPGTIGDYHNYPTENFKKAANAEAFVAGCAKLGLSENEIITADEFQSGEKFFSVVQTISALSQLSACEAASFVPFLALDRKETKVYGESQTKIQSMRSDGAKKVAKSNMAMLKHGPSLLGLAGLADLSYGSGTTQISVYEKARKKSNKSADDHGSGWDLLAAMVKNANENETQDHDVYQQLLYTTSLYNDADTTNHRGHALHELLTTEQKYNGVLDTMMNIYHRGLKSHPQICSADDMKVLFANVAELQGIHKAFLSLLEAQMKSTSGRMLGNAFIHSVECFRGYAEYCCRMPIAIDRYEELRAKSQPALTLFDDLKKESGTDFPFRVLLNVPMQRVLKYPLLLREISKGTPDTHADKENLGEAMLQIQGLAKLVNETMRDFENVQAVAKRLKNYTGPPLTDYYTFHKFRMSQFLDGDVAYKKEGSKDKLMKTYAFLLPSAVLITTAKNADYFFICLIEINANTTVETIEAPKALQTGKFKDAIKVSLEGSEDVHLFVFDGTSTQDEWASAIENNIKAIQETRDRPTPEVPEPSKLPPPRVIAQGSPRASPTPEHDDNTAPYALAMPEEPKVALHPFAKMPWYMGKAGANDAARTLQGKKDSTYLIRESTNRPGNYTLGVMFEGKVVHIPIASTETDGVKSFILGGSKTNQNTTFESIIALVQHYRTNDVAAQCRTKLRLPFKEAR